MPQQSITEQIDRLDAHADMLAYINADIDLLFDQCKIEVVDWESRCEAAEHDVEVVLTQGEKWMRKYEAAKLENEELKSKYETVVRKNRVHEAKVERRRGRCPIRVMGKGRVTVGVTLGN
jgi:hypothetical protein